MNRHQYYLTLGRAYLFTGDERFAECFASHMHSWMTANPPKVGINWASSLEVAFRAISWTWALSFFRRSPAVSGRIWLEALKYLYVSACHLETYLSTWFSPNTHLTGEALGLYYLGSAFPEFQRAAIWRETGERTLLEQLQTQVLPDGVYFERSTWYHRYTTDFYTHFLLLRQRQGKHENEFIENKLTQLLDHLMYLTRPDGSTPLIGDDDGGRLVQLDERACNDFRATLSNGAAMFGRADWKYVSGGVSEETLWLLGPGGVESFDALSTDEPAKSSAGFKDGGYYVMRDGWTPDSNFLAIDCGPLGALSCGHAHADGLAIDLAAMGQTFIADPGTYTYTASTIERNWFRSAAAHSTVLVDGDGWSEPAVEPFNWQSVNSASLRRWHTTERVDVFEGSQEFQCSSWVKHSRTIIFIKGEYWLVHDKLESTSPHQYSVQYHLAPGIELKLDHDRTGALRAVGDLEKSLYIFGVGGDWSFNSGFASVCYGSKTESRIASLSATGSNHEFVSALLPSLTANSAVSQVEQRGSITEIRRGGETDLLYTGLRKTETDGRLKADFQMTWVRMSPGSEFATEIIAINGSRIRFDDCQIFESERRIDLLIARREKGRVMVSAMIGDQEMISYELELPFKNFEVKDS